MIRYYEGYLAYIRHRSVNLPSYYKLGDSDNEAQNCLIINLYERKAHCPRENFRETLFTAQSMTDENTSQRIQEIFEGLESTATFEG